MVALRGSACLKRLNPVDFNRWSWKVGIFDALKGGETMTVPRDPMAYDMILKNTEASTGFFACEPNPALSLEEALAFTG